jgi:hypothetical protein
MRSNDAHRYDLYVMIRPKVPLQWDPTVRPHQALILFIDFAPDMLIGDGAFAIAAFDNFDHTLADNGCDRLRAARLDGFGWLR